MVTRRAPDFVGEEQLEEKSLVNEPSEISKSNQKTLAQKAKESELNQSFTNENLKAAPKLLSELFGDSEYRTPILRDIKRK